MPFFSFQIYLLASVLEELYILYLHLYFRYQVNVLYGSIMSHSFQRNFFQCWTRHVHSSQIQYKSMNTFKCFFLWCSYLVSSEQDLLICYVRDEESRHSRNVNLLCVMKRLGTHETLICCVCVIKRLSTLMDIFM